jgi:hypothetical protein
MTDLSSIPGIGQAARELLEAAGLFDAEALAKAGVDNLAGELARANKMLRLGADVPSQQTLAAWIDAARVSAGTVAAPVAVPDTAVNYEAMPHILELLATAPLAIPLPAKHLIEKHLAVSDIPPAILLSHYTGELDIRMTDGDAPRAAAPAPMLAAGRAASSASYVRLAEPVQRRMDMDTSRLRSIADMAKAGQRVPLSVNPSTPGAASENDRVALIRAPLAVTNSGRDPRSRFYVRGVLHTHPLSMTFGAAVTLIMALLSPLAVGAALLLLLNVLFPESFQWVSPWLLVLPCCLPVVGMFYLIYGLGGKCRICNQRVFLPRACLKNSKAHYFRGLGHIIPMSIHLLVFRWFRCTFCGTPVRLKK